MDSKPSFTELLEFGGKNVDLIRQIGRDYYTFGVIILRDDTGTRLANLEAQYQGDAYSINRAILTKWLNGEGMKPTTWATLVTVLKESRLNALAEDVSSVKGNFHCINQNVN